MTIKENETAIKNINEAIKELRLLIVGNGKVGLAESMRQLNTRVGVIESDSKETKKMVQEMVGYSGVRYDEGTHPGRRKTDGKEEEKEFLSYDWMKENVFPGLVEKIIVAIVTATFVLIITHWPLTG